MRRWLVRLALAVPLLFVVLLGGGLWVASSQLLFPAFRGANKDLSVCTPELTYAFGKHCGNLRASSTLRFREVKIPALSGASLPGWLIGSAENQKGAAQGAILLVHGGGSDRREMTRHASFYLERRLDVVFFSSRNALPHSSMLLVCELPRGERRQSPQMAVPAIAQLGMSRRPVQGSPPATQPWWREGSGKVAVLYVGHERHRRGSATPAVSTAEKS